MKKLILLLLIFTQQLFALVSIVPVEIGENPGFHGKTALSLETKRGNTHKDNYKLAIRFDYDDKRNYHTWIEMSGEYGESNYVKDTSKLYLHLRHIQAIGYKNVHAEGFTQTQNDEFKLIKRRYVLGGGLRFKIFEIFDEGKGYFGAGGFYENIQYTSIDPREHNFRLNSYFAYTIKLGDDSDLSYTAFYQPKINEFSDYVSAQKLELKLHVYKRLFLNFQLAYDVDHNPPIGVEKYDFTQTTSFVFDF
ncbi:MAG: DUF481 domain-containing protein [Campylobacterota bacterium]|nr:DUF481 domain-containing protein [Campylobacterota bacterium]